MTNPLANQLVKTGLLEFGLFGREEVPLRLNLQLLPAYPHLLKEVAKRARERIAGLQVDRLVCKHPSLPFGLVLSQQTTIPLVYSLDTDQPGVLDLVGAYDVGHPALLLTNTFDVDDGTAEVVEKAGNVGLEIASVLAIIDLSKNTRSGMNVVALLKLRDVLAHLTESGLLPHGHAEFVRDWLDQRPEIR